MKQKTADPNSIHIAKPHMPTLKPKLVKEYAMPTRITAFQDGFRIAHAQKNKILELREKDSEYRKNIINTLIIK